MSKKQGLLLGFVLVLTILAAFLFYQSTFGAPRQPATEETWTTAYTVQTQTTIEDQTQTTIKEQVPTQTTKLQTETSATKEQTKPPTTETRTQPPAPTEKPTSVVKQYTFRSLQLWESHYQKHGDEFGFNSKEEYLRGANNLIRSDNPNLLTKYDKDDGDKLFYLESTNEFLVLSVDGYIRTYFKPDNGIRYFNKQ